MFSNGDLVLNNDRSPGCGISNDLINSLDTVLVRGVGPLTGVIHMPGGRATLLDSFRIGHSHVTRRALGGGMAGVSNIPD